jgi:hypothetical protein
VRFPSGAGRTCRTSDSGRRLRAGRPAASAVIGTTGRVAWARAGSSWRARRRDDSASRQDGTQAHSLSPPAPRGARPRRLLLDHPGRLGSGQPDGERLVPGRDRPACRPCDLTRSAVPSPRPSRHTERRHARPCRGRPHHGTPAAPPTASERNPSRSATLHRGPGRRAASGCHQDVPRPDQSHFTRHFKRHVGVTPASSSKQQERTKGLQERHIFRLPLPPTIPYDWGGSPAPPR